MSQQTWDDARSELAGLPDGGLNIAYEAVDRHVIEGQGDRTALRWLEKDGATRSYTYADLYDASNRFASVLRDLGVGKGDRVYSLAGRIPALYVTALGTLRNGSVFCPLFSAFGPEPIRDRLRIGSGRVLVTTASLYARKVAQIRDEVPALKHVLLTGAEGQTPPGTNDLDALLEAADRSPCVERTMPEDMALIHFTSGTTGLPKGAVHVHDAVVVHRSTAGHALDLRADDVFWCTADPGWITGTSYGIIAPLVWGATMLVDEAEFDAERWYRTLQDQHVTVWYTAPTAVRMLMRAGDDLPATFDLSALRFIASVGETLNPEAVTWSRDVLGLPMHDNWWQTETGGIMIANTPAMEIKPGSMGKPLPGIEAAILRRDEDGVVIAGGRAEEITDPDLEGELALRPGWPSMFRGYLGEDERYAKCFAGGWYLSGDVVRRDADGYYWFVGRADDVIKTAGHLIGPTEVESALMEHPAVAEAGVIGKPDPMAGEIVKAFVTLGMGVEPSEELRREILGFARKRLGPAVAPREIAFDPHLPHTRSGKIMRRLLKAREMGLAEGDTSTLEET